MSVATRLLCCVNSSSSIEHPIKHLAHLSSVSAQVRKVVCGGFGCLVLLQNGDLYYGKSMENSHDSLQMIDATHFGNYQVVDVAVGEAHCLAITVVGGVFSWGQGSQGQLGRGLLDPSPTPKKIDAMNPFRVVQVSCGAYHSLLLTDKGHAYAFGRGIEGQLGLKNFQLQTGPRLVQKLFSKRIIKIHSAQHTSAFLADDGSVYACGDGECGMLGQANTKTLNAPTQIALPSGTGRIVDVSVGWGHLLVTDDSGRVFSCGLNAKGQLGHDGACGTVHPQMQAVPIQKVLPFEDKGGWVAQKPIPVPLDFSAADDPTSPIRSPEPEIDAEDHQISTSSPVAASKVEGLLPPSFESVHCGKFWSAARCGHDVYAWGSFGCELEINRRFMHLNSFLPPTTQIAAVWSSPESAILLVDFPPGYEPPQDPPSESA